MGTELDSLPRKSGFRLRGEGMSRLETFADAAFAFALTLLVISFDEIPSSYDELVHALKSVPAFAASFAIIVMFWVAHRRWSERYGLDDTASTILTAMLVFVIMVYVYPLRAMTAASLNSMTGGWVPTELRFESFAQVRGIFVIYGSGWFIASLILVLLNRHALRRADSLDLNTLERSITVSEVQAWSLVGGFGLISILLALSLPEHLLGLAGYFYFGLAFVMPWHRVSSSKRRQKLRS